MSKTYLKSDHFNGGRITATRKAMAKRQSPQRPTLLVKGGGTAWLDGNVSGRSRPIYNHAVDRGRESCTFSVLG
jgi:hypothetical protein